MSDLTDEQTTRVAALDCVLHLFRGTDIPSPADIIAMAEWVVDGSITAATALEGQKAALYRAEHRGDA
jgi:hypothetical protein